jgi:VanZ family protein
MIKKRSVVHWLPAVLWMGLIFFLSSQPAVSSNSLSKGLTKLIIEILGRILPVDIEISTVDVYVSRMNHFVRKFAHFFAYMILGIFVSNGFKKSGSKKVFLLSFAICAIYAVSDELHQLYVPGRGCRLKDVIIDSAGSLTGIFLAKEYFRLSKKFKRRLP